MRYLCTTKKKDSGTEVASFMFFLWMFWNQQNFREYKTQKFQSWRLTEERNACYWFPAWLSKISDACYVIRHMRHEILYTVFFLNMNLGKCFHQLLTERHVKGSLHSFQKKYNCVKKISNTQSTKHLQTKDQTAWGGTHFLL